MEKQQFVTLTKRNFNHEVLKSDKPVLVDFWAAWCGPCRAIAPAIDELARTFEGQAKIGKLNIDDYLDVADAYNIQSIPSLLFFKDGRVIDRITGLTPKTVLETKLKALVSSN